MNPAAALKQKVENIFVKKSDVEIEEPVRRPTILIATIDPQIRNAVTDLLEGLSFESVWLKSVEAVKNRMAKEKMAACLCGFWLQDGTYRELVRHVRRERVDVPMVILSAPASPNEYGNFLAAMNIGTINFLSYPYQKSDLDRLLCVTRAADTLPVQQQPSMIGSDLCAGEAA